MFTGKSRYKETEQYTMTDRRGRKVQVVAVPEHESQSLVGFHRLVQGQRIDHLAFRYIQDEAGFWKIADANDAMLPEAVTEKPEIGIPNR